MSISCFIASGCPIATTTLYRCLHLQEQLEELGYTARVAEWFDEAAIDIDDALRCEVLFLYRLPMSPPLRRLIDRARALRKPIIFDTDDLIFEPDLIEQQRAVRNLTPADQLQHAAGVRQYLETLLACDRVVTATPFLAGLATKRGAVAFVHRNGLGQAMLAHATSLCARRTSRGPRTEIVIGYGSGTATHEVDFAEAEGALLQVLERFGEVQLWIAGPLAISARFDRFGARVRRFPLTDWREWLVLASQMDIALGPLEQGNVFCRAKSEIKFVEAGAVGVPLVASRIDTFQDAITEGEDGLLAANETEWITALTSLIEDPTRRTQMGERARQTVLQRYSPAARTRDLALLLPHLAPSVFPEGSLPPAPRRRLTVNWLIPEPSAGAGGDLGIFRIIRHLAEFGHDCRVHVIAYDRMRDYSTEQVRAYVAQHFGSTPAHYQKWTGAVADADCTCATFWPTAESALTLTNGGRRFYLVQDFEPAFYPGDTHHTERAEKTYRAGFHCLTLGSWLAKLLRERYAAAADHFDFAVDPQIYRPRPGARAAGRRVCFYARPATPRRGYELGLAALGLVKARLPEVEIVLYGTADLQSAPAFPFVDRGLLCPPDLAALFSVCDVGLVLSFSNPSFVPLEMMACGCAVVDLASERMAGIATHEHDAWLVAPQAEAIAEGIVRLLEDDALRERLIANASARVRPMDWRHSARQIETVLRRELGARA